MRLKQLEIKGFKSFASETIVNFSEDVIGIVGPNGSGKSNIVDAIRWVLGEQKKLEGITIIGSLHSDDAYYLVSLCGRFGCGPIK